jgi:3,4-dihydroxy 2-butanone 4-phosphate synthase/GTP cyclohydrolase II
MARVAAAGRGAVVYLRGHEGRGIGLGHKLRAYELQDAGRDTVEANLDLGVPVDSREYGTGAQILADLGARRVRLLTNNPAKYGGLTGHGLEVVGREPLETVPNPENLVYLRTKKRRLGHLLDHVDDAPAAGGPPPRLHPADPRPAAELLAGSRTALR